MLLGSHEARARIGGAEEADHPTGQGAAFDPLDLGKSEQLRFRGIGEIGGFREGPGNPRSTAQNAVESVPLLPRRYFTPGVGTPTQSAG